MGDFQTKISNWKLENLKKIYFQNGAFQNRNSCLEMGLLKNTVGNRILKKR